MDRVVRFALRDRTNLFREIRKVKAQKISIQSKKISKRRVKKTKPVKKSKTNKTVAKKAAKIMTKNSAEELKEQHISQPVANESMLNATETNLPKDSDYELAPILK